MKMPSDETPEQLALHQVHALCLGHVEALQDALKDMAQRFERLQVAIEAAGQLLTLMSHISQKLLQRFSSKAPP